jgi:hypothetical protein
MASQNGGIFHLPAVLCGAVIFLFAGCSRDESPAPKQWRDAVFAVRTSETTEDGLVASGQARSRVGEIMSRGLLGGAVFHPDSGRHLIEVSHAAEVTSTGITVVIRIVYADDYSTVDASRKELTKTVTVPYGKAVRISLLPTVHTEAHFEPNP